MTPDWLPSLVLFSDYEGNWEKYVEVLYEYFKQDFIQKQTRFQGIQLRLKSYPLSQGKEATFWHLISEGKTEEDRIPDLRRCERIRWPRPMIINFKESQIKLWKNQRRGETRICLWLEDQEYIVILAERKDYVLLWTAYMVTENHSKRKLQKEFENYHKNNP
jgi:hypothetical protein